ncbi:MAG: hypothetical protein HEQ35_00085 [Gloeotrichia echinulata IR180]
MSRISIHYTEFCSFCSTAISANPLTSKFLLRKNILSILVLIASVTVKPEQLAVWLREQAVLSPHSHNEDVQAKYYFRRGDQTL